MATTRKPVRKATAKSTPRSKPAKPAARNVGNKAKPATAKRRSSAAKRPTAIKRARELAAMIESSAILPYWHSISVIPSGRDIAQLRVDWSWIRGIMANTARSSFTFTFRDDLDNRDEFSGYSDRFGYMSTGFDERRRPDFSYTDASDAMRKFSAIVERERIDFEEEQRGVEERRRRAEEGDRMREAAAKERDMEEVERREYRAKHHQSNEQPTSRRDDRAHESDARRDVYDPYDGKQWFDDHPPSDGRKMYW